MLSVADNSATVHSGTIPSIVKTGPFDSALAVGVSLKGLEKRIADRLSTAEYRMLQLVDYRKSKLTDVSRPAARVNRLPLASNVLSELVEIKGQDDIEARLALLLHCLDTIGQPINNERVAIRDYAAWMQLYSMLPIYLRLDQGDLPSALDESLFMAYQAISLIDLDQALECELFELLSESAFLNQAPSVALQNSLNVDLYKLVDEFGALAKQPRSDLVTGQRPSSDRCEGYWSIAQQWTGGAAHLRIPTKLSIGKVLWPKVREHWSRLSQALLELHVEPEATPTADDFVEIRSSNDPQLAKTLDIQLQRCRDQQRSMALVVFKVLEHPDQTMARSSDHCLPKWQEAVIEQLRIATDGQATRGFSCEAGELTLIIDDLDRNEVSAIIREIVDFASQPHNAASSMVEIPRIPIVCGIACVASPSKRFQIDQLIHSAWRCLEAAKLQGPGTVKSIEVF